MSASVRLTAGVLSSVVLLAGCGSTALRAGSVSQGGGSGQANDQGLGLPKGTTGGSGSTTGTAGLTTGGSSTGVGGGAGSGGAGTSGSSTAGSGAATSGSAGAGGSRSAVRSSITVGIVGVDPAAIAAAFGSTKSAGDIFASSRSMIAYVNERGGNNGRKLRAVYVTEDISKDSQQATSSYHTMLGRSAAAGLAGGHYSNGQLRVDGVGLVQPIKYDVTAKRFVPDGGTVSVP